MCSRRRARRSVCDDAELFVVAGSPGHRLCELAEELPASVIVMGTSGRGGIRRAFLGSVSDHVVRNAPVPGPDDRGQLTARRGHRRSRARIWARIVSDTETRRAQIPE